jgi:hypothetical protein
MKMKKFYGSDDGYDYQKENKNGDVDAYVAWVLELKRKENEENKNPQK